jgi:predicted negative regulator of RcsB-dependent stress response
MDTYRTEEEQVAALKGIVATHGSKILAVIVVLIAAVFSYQSYQQKQLSDKQNASIYYSQLNDAVGFSEDLDEKQQAVFDANFAALLGEYPDSIYASYATFAKAKLEVSANKLDEAAASLQWIIEQNVAQEIVELARLRLARVIFSQGDLDAALALLNTPSSIFAAEYATSKGDVLVAKGDLAQALVAFEKAKNLAAQQQLADDRLLDMKINSLKPSADATLYPVKAQ